MTAVPPTARDGVPGAVRRVELPSDWAAARHARRHVSDVLAGIGCVDDDVEMAVLLTSELVSNAVAHGEPPIVMHVHRRARPSGTAVRVEVRDGGEPFDHLVELVQPDADDVDLLAECGRGLAMVDAVASSWGMTAHEVPAGKTVWFELDALTVAQP